MAENLLKHRYTNKAWISYPGQFGLLLAFFGVCVILLSVLLACYLLLQTNGNLDSLSNLNINNLNARTLRVVQALGTVLQFGIPAILFALILKQKPASYFKLNKIPSTTIIFYVILLAILGVTFSDLLARFNESIPLSVELKAYFSTIEEKYFEQIFQIADFSSFGSFLLTLFIVAMLPAFFEELLFRGALQPILVGWTKNVFWGILLTSILFSLMHFSFFGFLPRMFLGMTLGYLFYYSKNLWTNISFHFVNNAFAVISYYIYSLKGKLDYSIASEKLPIFYSITGSILFFVAFYFFYKQSVKENKPVSE